MFKKRFFIKLPAISHDKNKLASLPGTRALWNFRSLEEHRMLYRKLFCDCKHCLLMKLENVSKCENQDVVGPPSEWKLHISRQLENPVFEDDESEVSDQFDAADAVELNPRVKKLQKRKRKPSTLTKKSQKIKRKKKKKRRKAGRPAKEKTPPVSSVYKKSPHKGITSTGTGNRYRAEEKLFCASSPLRTRKRYPGR